MPLIAVSASTRLQDGLERVRLNQAYIHALEQAGLVPLVVPPLADDAAAPAILRNVRGLVLTGGEDIDAAHFGARRHPRAFAPHPRRDRWELTLCAEARRLALPTLAICRGIQLVNVALGGTLIQDVASERPAATVHDGHPRQARVHEVQVTPASRLATALGATRVTVNSSHHQAIDRLGEGLVTTAVAGDGIVEGIESTSDDWWLVGVQWHPEELVGTPEAWDRSLFSAFAAACAAGTTAAT
jgi:putative glutamine amidotransferase